MMKLVRYLSSPWLLGPITVYLIFKLYSKTRAKYCTNKKLLHGYTILVTGGSNGIGLEIVKDLAKRGAKIIIADINTEKGEKEKDAISASTGNQNIHVRFIDLSSMSSVRSFCEEFIRTEDRLDILITNAGIITRSFKMTSDKQEKTMASNFFGHFLLTNMLLELLKKSAPSRIIQTSSFMYKHLDVSTMADINSVKSYKHREAYAKSKLAQLLFAIELTEQLKGSGVTINSFNPGITATDIYWEKNSILNMPGYLFMHVCGKSTKEAAQTGIYLATEDEALVKSGRYFSNCQEEELLPYARDPVLAKRLWRISEIMTGLNSPS